ncbi:MAG: hypothetical protein HYT87_12870 [Nitrospirae bacterium]|nr:hypothetical protein [Nitrospirota bacterium]
MCVCGHERHEHGREDLVCMICQPGECDGYRPDMSLYPDRGDLIEKMATGGIQDGGQAGRRTLYLLQPKGHANGMGLPAPLRQAGEDQTAWEGARLTLSAPEAGRPGRVLITRKT